MDIEHTYDIAVMKKILKRDDLSLLVNSDDLATENYFKALSREPDNVSYDSNDTRYVLGKRKINLPKFIEEIHAKLEYITSGATGHTFRGDVYQDDKIIYEFAMKVSAYPKRSNYGDITNMQRPENAEIVMLRTLSYFVMNKQTPHLILPFVTFYTDIKCFLLLPKYGYIRKNQKKYNEFINRYNAGKYENTVSILLSEWANRGDFLDFIKKRYLNFKLIHWKIFLFQILSVLAVIQHKYPSFRHNDMKANNILVHKLSSHHPSIYHYNIGTKTYNVPNIKYQIKLWDFDFACIEVLVDNIKVQEEWTREININSKKNQYYDMHYFFNTLLNFFPDITNAKTVPVEVKEFIYRVVPSVYRTPPRVSEKGRILVDDEYTTPQIVIDNDPFFADFR